MRCDVRVCEMWDVRCVRCDVCFGCVRTKKSFTNFEGLQKLISVFSRKQVLCFRENRPTS